MALHKRQRTHFKLLSEINVTPFVDVMLVLLIVFMITAPLLNTGVDIQLPSAQGQALKSKKEPVVLTLTKKGQIFLGKHVVALSVLPKKLNAILGTHARTTIYVRGDKSVSYGAVMQLMNAVQKAGYHNVALVTEVEPL